MIYGLKNQNWIFPVLIQKVCTSWFRVSNSVKLLWEKNVYLVHKLTIILARAPTTIETRFPISIGISQTTINVSVIKFTIFIRNQQNKVYVRYKYLENLEVIIIYNTCDKVSLINELLQRRQGHFLYCIRWKVYFAIHFEYKYL